MAETPLRVMRDARIAGIRTDATLQAVHRRRSHLFFVMLVVLVGLCVATATAPFDPARGPVDARVLRFGMIGLSFAFVIYAVEKERALRRLESVLIQGERNLAAMTREAEQLQRLINAGHALNATLELERVIDLALAAAMRIFDAPGGAVFLDRGDLVLQAIRGDRHRLDLADQHARSAVASRTPVLVAGSEPDSPQGMAAPMIHDQTVVGALVIYGDETTGFDANHLRLFEAFARHAAAALANARLYRAEKTANEQFTGLNDIQREFSWLSSAG